MHKAWRAEFLQQIKLFSDLVDGRLKTGDTALCLTSVDDLLTGGLVQGGRGDLEGLLGLCNILLLDGSTNSLDGVLDAGLGDAVTGATLQALTVPFQGGLVISQGKNS